MRIDPQLLRTARLAARLAPYELADRIGRSRGYIYHLENGRRGATLATIRLLEEALNVSADQLGVTGLPARSDQEGS